MTGDPVTAGRVTAGRVTAGRVAAGPVAAGSRPALLAAGETMAMVTPVLAEPVEGAELFHIDAGGAESNVAGHVAALGHPARWVSRLGDDPLGRRIAAVLGGRGVDLSGVVIDPAHRTGLYVKNPGAGVHYYRDGSAASHLDAADADAVDLDGVGIVHVSGITAALGGTAPVFLDRLVGRARAAGVTVSVDVNHRAALWTTDAAAPALLALARRADIVFVGRDEAESLWGTADAASIRSLLPEVPELVVKDGDVGATVFEAGGETFVAALRVDVIEPVGAGDAFAGGYLAARLAGEPAEARLTAGHARAALTLRTTGDFPDDTQTSGASDDRQIVGAPGAPQTPDDAQTAGASDDRQSAAAPGAPQTPDDTQTPGASDDRQSVGAPAAQTAGAPGAPAAQTPGTPADPQTAGVPSDDQTTDPLAGRTAGTSEKETP